MMRQFLFTILIISYSISSYAQHSTFKQGDHLVSASAGILNPESFAFDILGFSGSGDPSPALNLHYQYSISDKVALGGYGSYYRVNGSYVNSIDDLITNFGTDVLGDVLGGLACSLLGNCDDVSATERVNVITLGGTLTYHTQISDAIDMYGTTYLGYSFNRRKSFTAELLDVLVDQTGLGIKIPNVVYFTGVGGRYFFNENVAAYGEVGYGNSHIIHLGLSYKFSTLGSDTKRVRTRN